MKRSLLLSASLALLAFSSIGLAETPKGAWEQLKSLAGDWEGTADGKPASVSYKVVSSGTAVMETIDGSDAMQMVTMYHPDGKNFLMTHYCSMGNQPRLRSKGLENGKMTFSYVDAANLKSPGEMRMTHLVMSFPDSDHLLMEWTATMGDKEKAASFAFTRKK